jgi:uncharacterized membrane protein YphA (DoxX/SURF4 family)
MAALALCVAIYLGATSRWTVFVLMLIVAVFYAAVGWYYGHRRDG